MRTEPTRPLVDRLAVGAALALALIAVAPAALAALWDVDVWWILRAGDDLIAEGRAPVRNRYGFTAPEHPWVMHEWGFGVAYAALRQRFGVASLAWVRIAAVGAVAWVSAWRALRDARGAIAALCVAVALTVYGGRFESPRPVGIAYAWAAIVACVVFEARFAWRHAAVVAAVIAAWTNTHGSFPLGVALTALGALTPDGDRRARWGALALACAVTALNPYGLALHGLALRYALGGGGDAVAVVHDRILEWWPLWRDPLRVASPMELAGGVALALVWLRALGEPRWRTRALAGLALLAMALQHNRHLALAGVVGSALAAGPVEQWLGGGVWTPRDTPRATWAFGALPWVAGAALWCVAARARNESAWIEPSQQDDAVRGFVTSLPRGARVFAELPFTGYVIDVGAPGVTVFFDARNDCYPAALLREAMNINDGIATPTAAEATLRAHGATHAIVRCVSKATRSLARMERTGERAGVCLYAWPR